MTESAKTKLLSLLPRLPGTLIFFEKGEGRPFAHHRSNRLPREVYADAELSPFFCNLRCPMNLGDKQGSLTPEAVALVGECLCELVYAVRPPTAIAGIPNAGDPLAEAVVAASRRRGLELQAVRFVKNDGPDGTQFARHDARTDLMVDVVVDDVITMADTKRRFLVAVNGPMADKPLVCVLFDRCEGGVEILRALGYDVLSVFTLPDILASSREAGLIDDEKVERSFEYAKRRHSLINLRMEEILADLRANL